MSMPLFKSGFAVVLAFVIMFLGSFSIVESGGLGGGKPAEYPPAEPPSDPPEIALVIEYSNGAWGFQQNVTVVTKDGRCYYKSVSEHDGDEHGDADIRPIDVSDYDELLEITRDPGLMLKEIKNMNSVWTYYPRFSEWSLLPLKDYDAEACDYGERSLYAYYNTEGGLNRVTVASSGDYQWCVNDKDAIAFANEWLPRLPGFDFSR